MPTRFINKAQRLADLLNEPNASGIGVFGGQVYMNINGSIAPLGGLPFTNVILVDGDDGSDTDTRLPYKTIQAAVTAASAGDTILIKAMDIAAGGTDPSNYAETIIIPAGKSGLRLIGIANGLAQGALPQIKKGSGSTALLTVRSPGCLIANLGFNGASSTGGGILLDDDGSTKTAFGTVIQGCHFKNCKGHATNSTLGGAITWSSAGGAWQVTIIGNSFFDNVGGIVLIGTSTDRPKDVKIIGNVFGGSAAGNIDSYIYGAGGSGFNDVTIHSNVFTTVKPAIGSGTVARYVDLTGVASGIFSDNYFASTDTTTGFGAGKATAKIPTTVGIAHCYSDGGLIVREA